MKLKKILYWLPIIILIIYWIMYIPLFKYVATISEGKVDSGVVSNSTMKYINIAVICIAIVMKIILRGKNCGIGKKLNIFTNIIFALLCITTFIVNILFSFA